MLHERLGEAERGRREADEREGEQRRRSDSVEKRKLRRAKAGDGRGS